MFKKIIALVLVVSSLLMSLPLTASAATGEYISEVRMATGKTAEECRKWLTDNGYIVVDQNLNEDTGKNYSYIGYKTTSDANNAITDMKIMNMNGGFVANDTAAEIQKMQGEMNAFTQEAMKVVDKVRENYKAGDLYAKAAVAGLNVMTYDPEMKVPLGDWLMGDPTADELKNIIFFSEPFISYAVFTHLATGLRTENEVSWIERTLANMADGKKKYSEETEDRAYDDIYPAVIASAEIYNEILVKDAETLDESEAMFAVKMCGTFVDKNQNKLLLDCVTNPDLSAEDLFAMADTISDEQITVASVIGLLNTLTPSLLSIEDIENLIKKCGESEKCYMFEGIDPETFNKPVALTVNALKEQNLDKSSDESDSENNNHYVIAEVLCVVFGAGLLAGAFIAQHFLNAAILSVSTPYATTLSFSKLIEAFKFLGFPTAKITFLYALSITLAVVGVVAILACIVIAIVSSKDSLDDYYNPDYTDIPFFMMDATQNPLNGADVYVTYRSVLDQNGNPGDLNTWQGKAWNAVYTTKDQKVGKPIRANVLTKTGNAEIPEGYFPVANFGEYIAANLNQSVYNNKTRLFMFVERNENHVSYLASVFGNGGAILLIGFGLVVGCLGGSVVTSQISKRRKKQIV